MMRLWTRLVRRHPRAVINAGLGFDLVLLLGLLHAVWLTHRELSATGTSLSRFGLDLVFQGLHVVESSWLIAQARQLLDLRRMIGEWEAEDDAD